MSSNYRSILNVQGSSFSTNSFTFDGNSDYINANSSSGFISGDNTGTISLWVQPNDITNNQTILCFSNSSETRRYIAFGFNSSLGFYVEMRTTISANSGFLVHADVNPFSVGTWTHLAIVQNGVSPQLYVDGVAVSQTFWCLHQTING